MKRRTIRTPIAALALIALLFSAMPASIAVASPGDEPGPVEATLDHLSEILKNLEGELCALEAPRAERLEEGLEQLIELIENLLDEFDRPREEGDAIVLKARILKLDLMLHRLITVLDGLLERPEQDRAGDREAIDDLRNWVAGYIDGLTATLDPQAAERVERAVHEMVRDLMHRIAEMTERTQQDEPEHPKLERLFRHLEVLVTRLDGFILRRFPRIPNLR